MSDSVRGFTLIEMMVSVALFSIVMLVGMSALFTLVSENKRAQALNSVITDLNFSLESMARTIRTGYAYGCNFSVGSDCTSGSNRLQLNAVINNEEYRVRYRYRQSGGRGFIERQLVPIAGGSSLGWIEITSANVDIEEFNFFVFGASGSDQFQPRVMIALSGIAESGEETSDFSIQSTVTQRIIDL
tara:strand:- start:6102 stop:6662 length:561 start_codon:yes stop_codon:yes gene_type:complete